MIDHLCSDWNKIFREDSGAAKYWNRARLLVDVDQYPHQAQDLLGSRILRLVPDISICRADQNLKKLFFESVRNGVAVQLKKLTIRGGLDNIDIVAGAAMKLETLNAELSRPQVEAVLTMLAATEDSRLRDLVVYGGGGANLSLLDPEVVAGALIKLKTVKTDIHGLSNGQLSALFSRILQAPVLRLTRLHLWGKVLSLVPPQVMAGAIQRLEVVELQLGRMTGEQATVILTLAKEERLGRIKTIKIYQIRGMRSVSPALIQEARLNAKLKWIV